MNTFIQDLRYGARMLLKRPGFTLIAIITLALGIGANTALFSVVDAILLKKLPVKEPERLVLFKSVAPTQFSPGNYTGSTGTDPATGQKLMTSFAYQSFTAMRDRESVLSDVFAFGDVNLNVNADGQAEVASGQAVSGNYYGGLGVKALLGRPITDEDDTASASPVAVISYRYWQRRFSGDRAVIGKQVNLNTVPFSIVGVTPPGFEGTGQVGSTQDVSIPIACEPRLYVERNRSRMTGAGGWWLRVMGRLKPRATPEEARAELEAVFQQTVVAHRAERQSLATPGNPISALDEKDYPRLVLESGSQGEMTSRRFLAPSLYLLLGAVGVLLLIACANVASLLLVRASARQKEIGVRLALGATRWRLIRQLLTESILLAGLGSVLGVLFAIWIKDGLIAVTVWGGRGMLGPQLDLRVLGFTLALSVLTGMVFGIAPAWRATNVDLLPALKDSGQSTSVASRSVLTRSLVVAQVAMSLLLLVGAGLFLRTLLNLQLVDPGFNTANLLLFGVEPGLIGYKDEKLAQLYRQIAERLETVPGVESVTFSRMALLSRGSSSRGIYLPGSDGRMQSAGQGYIHQARENFTDVMGIPLLVGRSLTTQDDSRAPKVAVVNQTFADRYFPGESPLGKRFTFDSNKPGEVEIVGLVRDAKYTRQRDDTPPTAYLPWLQELRSMSGAIFAVRTAADPSIVISAIWQEVGEVDGNLPLNYVRTQIEQIDETLAMERLFARLLGLFGLVAQLLASIGLYGVLAYSVAQRTHELGVRMALGASPGAVRKVVLKQGLKLTILGLGVGMLGAYLLTRYLESAMNLTGMLYGVTLTDPLTYGVISLVLMLVALVACWIPAQRATKIDPMIALRYE